MYAPLHRPDRSVPTRGLRFAAAFTRRFGTAFLFAVLATCSGGFAADPAVPDGKGKKQDPEQERAPTAAEGLAFFEQKIRPVLVAKCYECHTAGTKQMKGGLALDSRAGLLQGGDSGPAVIAGNPDESPLVQAIRYDGVEMPPTERLPKEIADDFARWVKMGAPDPREGAAAAARKPIDIEEGRKHWAFQPPRLHPLPTVRSVEGASSPIDAFIAAKLEAAGLAANPPADRRTLLRRVSFDLTGLPPTPEEAAEFEKDSSPDAFEKAVDRLLASPAFGERWGRHWLDLARYSDSNGKDENLTFPYAWRYRDYVVDSFNHDKPYDQFVREQIAGDLIGHPEEKERMQKLIATGFLVMGPKVLAERDKVQLKMDVIDEQIDTLGRAFLGMTIGCARCHDHKFDPIPTRDYYGLAGIFSSTVTIQGIKAGNAVISGWSERPLGEEGERQQKELAEYTKKLQQTSNDLKKARELLKKFDDKAMMKQPALLTGVIVDDVEAKFVGDWKASTHNPRYVGDGYRHDDKLEKGKRSALFTPNLPAAGEYEVYLAYTGGKGRSTNTPVTIHHDGGEKSLRVDQTETPKIDGLFESVGVFRFKAGREGWVKIETHDTEGYVIVDAVQFLPAGQVPSTVALAKPGKEPEKKAAPKDAKEKEAAAKDQEKDKQKPAGVGEAKEKDIGVPEEVKAELAEAKKKVEALEALEKELKAQKPATPLMAMAVKDAPDPADVRIHVRGSIFQLGETAPRSVLQAATLKSKTPPVMPKNESGRRELADWLADRDNPLTARVMVNRVWMHLFGEGLVRSVDNFGLTGEKPSHPELLDTLAVEFMDDGWSVKRLIRRIVLSRTYRESSRVQIAAAEKDPENRLLSRTFRRRLEAEAMRDSILAVSGKLDRAVGGSAVDKLGERAIDNSSKGGLETEEVVRRSLYLPIIRNETPTFLAAFDFADPDVGNGKRDVTTVAPQALYLLNSAFVQDQARIAASRLLSEAPDDASRVRRAYNLAYAREPSDSELHAATAFVESFSKRLAELDADAGAEEGKDAASEKDKSKGKGKVKVKKPVDSPQLRAWSAFSQAVFGSTEFRYVD